MKHLFECPDCGIEFEAEEPPMTIPVSWVSCPQCGKPANWIKELRAKDET